MKVFARLRSWAATIKSDVLTVYFAARDPRTPLLVRLLALLVAAYALSPIDLIPDFIPVLGSLDDLILVPLAIVLLVRLIPEEVLSDARAKAELVGRVRSVVAAVFVALLWVLAVLGIGLYFYNRSQVAV